MVRHGGGADDGGDLDDFTGDEIDIEQLLGPDQHQPVDLSLEEDADLDDVNGADSIIEYTGYEPRAGDQVLHVPATVSPEELWNRFISKRRPVIIDGFPTDPEWQAHKWNDMEYLRRLAGHARVKVEPIHSSFGHFGTGTTRTKTTFGEFLDVLQDPKEAGKWYLTTQYESEEEESSDDEEAMDSSTEQEDEEPPTMLQASNGSDPNDPGAVKRKRGRDSLSPARSASSEAVKQPEDDQSGDEDSDQESVSITLSDSEAEPDIDEVLPSPTHALISDFAAQPKLMGGLVLQQCNLWLGNSEPPASKVGASAKDGSATVNTVGKSSGLHHDFHDNLYVLLSGRKRLLLFPPTAQSYLHPRGKVLRVHKNGLIVYEPRDHEVDAAVAEHLANSDPGYSSFFGGQADDEFIELLRVGERAIGRQRNLSIRPDGLTPLDMARWRIRARARALAEANERAAAEAGEHRVHRDRRKGKARQTKEQEEALSRYQAAKREFLIQQMMEEESAQGDDDDLGLEQGLADELDDFDDPLDGSRDDHLAVLGGGDLDSDEGIDHELDDAYALDTSRTQDLDDDASSSSSSSLDSVDLMEDLFNQQKLAILRLREEAKTDEERELQTMRLQILVQRRIEFLERREQIARSTTRSGDDPSGDEVALGRAGPAEEDEDGSEVEQEGWMMFDELEKRRRQLEDADAESGSAEDTNSAFDDDEDEDSQDLEDDDDSDLFEDDGQAAADAASAGLPTPPEGETELERALRLNGVDDSALAQKATRSTPAQATVKNGKAKSSSRERKGDISDGSTSSDGDDRIGDASSSDGSGSSASELDLAATEDGEAALTALEAQARRAGIPLEPQEEAQDGEDGGSEDSDDDSKEPSSFSLIKPHVLHAFYGLTGREAPGKAAITATSSKPKGSKRQGHLSNGNPNSQARAALKGELVPLPGCHQPLIVNLEPGQCLYLPASWWHEVTSMSTPEHPFHCALNFWFHPPTNFDAGRNGVQRNGTSSKRGRGGSRNDLGASDGHSTSRPSNGTATSASGAGSGMATDESAPSAFNPYEDAEVWDEIRRTVAKLVRGARRKAMHQRRAKGVATAGSSDGHKDAGEGNENVARTKRRRRE